MFYIKKLRKDVLLPPSFLGPHLKESVKRRVFEELEGVCLGKLGYVIAIIEIDDDEIFPGVIDIDTGSVNVIVYYSAIFFRPFRNEVLDAVCVMSTSESGILCKTGPCEIYIHHISMPEDMKFNHETNDCWVTEDETSEIREGTIVRLRILGTAVNAGVIKVIGTINDTFLGEKETES